MAQAAAANGGQQLVRSLGCQNKFDRAGWLFECFKQRVGGDAVHTLSRKHQHHLGCAAGAGELGKSHDFPRGVDLDLFAGFAFFAVEFVLRFFV